jgi:tetratricopeptide (TPR) repeat protein
MLMFLDQQVRADDPRLSRMYSYFQRNLSDIINAGQRAGARMVISTVAVNLRDCAPFASQLQAGMSEAEQARWQQAYREGVQFQQAGNARNALNEFERAASLDNRAADLEFRIGQCALELDDPGKAKRAFVVARDEDTLRFRCDSELNEIIRKVAAESATSRVLLADAESALSRQSPDGLPGHEYFYEHVHLTWQGNWLLARTIGDQVNRLLPAEVTGAPGTAANWPDADACARRLAWTALSDAQGISEILGRLQDPPFTQQLNHKEESARLHSRLIELAPAQQPDGLKKARAVCEAAAAASPSDVALQTQLSALRHQTGDTNGSLEAARKVVTLLPQWSDGWFQLGSILLQAHRDVDASEVLTHALKLDPENVWILNNLAQAHVLLGQKEAALKEYRRAAALKPRFGLAYLGIGKILEQQGHKKDAEDYYRKALENRIHRSAELTLLARFCASRGWLEAASTNYVDALKLAPDDAVLHRELAECLLALGRKDEAESQLKMVEQLEPDHYESHYLRGLELGRQNKTTEAAEEFRIVVRLSPALIEGRLNLGIALTKLGSNQEAQAQFQEVLQRSPTNQIARRYLELLQREPAGNSE